MKVKGIKDYIRVLIRRDMKVELEMTKEEFKEFLDIVQDEVENGGQPYETVMDNILGQLLEIDSKKDMECKHLFIETTENKLLCFNCKEVREK